MPFITARMKDPLSLITPAGSAWIRSRSTTCQNITLLWPDFSSTTLVTPLALLRRTTHLNS